MVTLKSVFYGSFLVNLMETIWNDPYLLQDKKICLESGYDGCPIELMHSRYIFYCLAFNQLWASFGGPKEETWSLALVVFKLVSIGVLGTYITCLLQEYEIVSNTSIRYSQPSTFS